MSPLSRFVFPITAVVALALPLRAAEAPADDTVLRAMRDELQRATTQLKLDGTEPPYFAAFKLSDSNTAGVAASFGALTGARGPDRVIERIATVELRVGSPALDQTSFVGGGGGSGSSGARPGNGLTERATCRQSAISASLSVLPLRDRISMRPKHGERNRMPDQPGAVPSR